MATIEEVAGDPLSLKVRWRERKPPGGRWGGGSDTVHGTTPTKTRKAAELRKSQIEAELADHGGWRAPEPDTTTTEPVTVAQWAWRCHQAVIDGYTPAAEKTRRYQIGNTIERDPIGALLLREVDEMAVREWIGRQRRRGVADSTIEGRLGDMRGWFRRAGPKRMPQGNPAAEIPKNALTPIPPARVVPTVDEVWLLAGAMPPRLRAMVLVQAGLGLRIGELCALCTTAVDDPDTVAEPWVHILCQVNPDRDWQLPKGRKIRDVPAAPWVLAALAAHADEWAPRTDPKFGELIFPNQWGRASADFYAAPFRAVSRQLAAAADQGGPPFPHGVTTHSLRHHFATEQLHGGASIHDVAAWLGDSTEMVHRVYGHSARRADQRGRSIMQAAWANKFPPRLAAVPAAETAASCVRNVSDDHGVAR